MIAIHSRRDKMNLKLGFVRMIDWSGAKCQDLNDWETQQITILLSNVIGQHELRNRNHKIA